MANHSKQGNALSFTRIEQSAFHDLILKNRPAKPLYVLFPEQIAETANHFVTAFPGKTLFAVKTNPDSRVLHALRKGGVQAFDVASMTEIKAVRAICSTSELHFMHPVKTPEDIRAAYFEYGVRHFVLDHEDELFKIMRETDLAQDLNLTVRLALPKNENALIDFSGKFGAHFEQALDLLEKCRPVSQSLGVSFHVGTQTTDTAAYSKAIAYVAHVVKCSNTKIDTLNVGGGFPVAYEGDTNMITVVDCVNAIQSSLNDHGLAHMKLLAEPGRVLVAKGAKLVTRIELRKDDTLYINDGVYGGLFDAAKWVGTHYPVAAITCDREFGVETKNFRLQGPTCDSLDLMEGPFNLPADIGIGDWIVFDNVGAYSQVLRSDFNGFGHADVMCI
jgi:ornithine decarboxylase